MRDKNVRIKGRLKWETCYSKDEFSSTEIVVEYFEKSKWKIKIKTAIITRKIKTVYLKNKI